MQQIYIILDEFIGEKIKAPYVSFREIVFENLNFIKVNPQFFKFKFVFESQVDNYITKRSTPCPSYQLKLFYTNLDKKRIVAKHIGRFYYGDVT